MDRCLRRLNDGRAAAVGNGTPAAGAVLSPGPLGTTPGSSRSAASFRSPRARRRSRICAPQCSPAAASRPFRNGAEPAQGNGRAPGPGESDASQQRGWMRVPIATRRALGGRVRVACEDASAESVIDSALHRGAAPARALALTAGRRNSDALTAGLFRPSSVRGAERVRRASRVRGRASSTAWRGLTGPRSVPVDRPEAGTRASGRADSRRALMQARGRPYRNPSTIRSTRRVRTDWNSGSSQR
jgi:hypothetical protein